MDHTLCPHSLTRLSSPAVTACKSDLSPTLSIFLSRLHQLCPLPCSLTHQQSPVPSPLLLLTSKSSATCFLSAESDSNCVRACGRANERAFACIFSQKGIPLLFCVPACKSQLPARLGHYTFKILYSEPNRYASEPSRYQSERRTWDNFSNSCPSLPS